MTTFCRLYQTWRFGWTRGGQIANPLESYKWHQGAGFVKRFDADGYLRIMEI